jgi:hypothetical protein
MEKEGHLTAQRQVEVEWRSWAVLDGVVLLPFDAAATVLASGAPALQIARGSQVEDEDGIRRSTLLVPAGTQARLVLPDGSSSPLATWTVRATEFTAGPRGPAFTSCEIACPTPASTCPQGQTCVTIADGPGRVCRP